MKKQIQNVPIRAQQRRRVRRRGAQRSVCESPLEHLNPNFGAKTKKTREIQTLHSGSLQHLAARVDAGQHGHLERAGGVLEDTRV